MIYAIIMNKFVIRFIVLLVRSGSLQIRHSLESDEGKYECVAENSIGVAYSYGANLYVRGGSSAVLRYRTDYVPEFLLISFWGH